MKQAPNVLPLSVVVGGGYNKFWHFKGRYRVVKGSRASKKSKTTALNIIKRMMEYPEANTLIVRKVFRTLKDSCFTELKWAINRLGVAGHWEVKESPLEMTYLPTGQKIYFRGLDDPLKVTSITVEHGYLCWLWIEEAYEIGNEADFDMLDESIRGAIPAETGLFKQITLTFNPWNEHHWMKKRFFDAPPSPDVLTLTTNYLCNEWLDDADKRVFETMRQNNPRRYRVAGLGDWGIVEGLVYENWKEQAFSVSEISAMEGVVSAFGLDFGYTNDPTALFCGLVDQKARIIWVFDSDISNGYNHTAFEIQKGLGLGWDITALDQKKLDRILSRPWTADGKTFRDRCWENKANLISGVQSSLTQGILRGQGLQNITTNIQKQFGVSRYKAGRLAHTETTYFNAISAAETYKELGVEKIEILETLDSHTCEICGGLDGTVIPLSQFEPGVTVPPFHPNCQGTTAPYIGDLEGERAARAENGEVYNVPANMSYSDWKKTFVDGGGKDGLTPVVSVKALRDKLAGKETELTALEDERKRLSDQWREARSDLFTYDYGAGEHSKFVQMSDDEYRAYKQALEDRRDEINRRMEEIRNLQDRPGISDAEYDRLADEARALRKERREIRYQLDNQLPDYEDWRDKYGNKGREYFEQRSSNLEQATKAAEDKIKAKQAEIDELKQQIEEAKAFEAEHAYDLKTLEEMRDEILEKHQKLIQKESQRTEFEGIVGGFDKDHANLYNKMADNFSGSSYYQRNAGWYSPSDHHVHMDLDSHPWDSRVGRTYTGAWKTKFHEEFHQLDHILGTRGFGGAKPGSWNFTSISTPTGQRMIAAIDRDVLRCINESVEWFNAEYGTTIKPVATLDRISGDAKNTFIKWLKAKAPGPKDRALIDTFTDAVGLTTKGKINPYGEGFWGHKLSYQKDRGKSGATSEVWANLGSFIFRGETEALDALAPFMPDTIDEYTKIVEEVIEYGKTHDISYMR